MYCLVFVCLMFDRWRILSVLVVIFGLIGVLI